jgi:hypothetical protein
MRTRPGPVQGTFLVMGCALSFALSGGNANSLTLTRENMICKYHKDVSAVEGLETLERT